MKLFAKVARSIKHNSKTKKIWKILKYLIKKIEEKFYKNFIKIFLKVASTIWPGCRYKYTKITALPQLFSPCGKYATKHVYLNTSILTWLSNPLFLQYCPQLTANWPDTHIPVTCHPHYIPPILRCVASRYNTSIAYQISIFLRKPFCPSKKVKTGAMSAILWMIILNTSENGQKSLKKICFSSIKLV